MSIILETRLSKEKIFELYCNQVYMGQQAGFSINGFGEASSAYFNKDVTNLTLAESAFLAALIRSPNRYNPYTKLDTATARRNQVLDSMAEAGAITQDEAKAAKATPLQVVPARGRIDVSDAPYFADYVQNQLGDMIAGAGAAEHLRIYTTIDMDLAARRVRCVDETDDCARQDPVETFRAGNVAGSARGDECEDWRDRRDGWRSRLFEEPVESRYRCFSSTGFSLQTIRLCDRVEYGLRSGAACDHAGHDLHGRAEDVHV